MEKFLIIDGNSIAFRAYYAMPYLTNPSGEPSGAVFGFANILIKLLTELKPNYVAVAFDHARETFRNKIFAEYKGTRKETPSDLILQFPKIKDMLTCMGIQVFESGGIEADDIIGTLSLKSGGTFNILLSGDRDLLQLVSDHTNVYLTKKGVTDILKVDLDVLREEFGLLPYQVIELKSLMGDASDNIPGVKGVGEKTAKDLISKYSCLENVYENLDEIKGKLREKLELSRSDAYMSKTLATIKRDCDIDFDISKCKFSLPFSNKAFEFFKNYGFSSIVKKTELFALQPTENSINVEKSVVSTTDELKEILQKIGDFFAINLKKCEFSIDFSKIYVLKDKIDLFGGGVNIEDFCAILKPIFEDEKIEKITCDSKFDIKFLSKLNINLTNYFDLSIAKYLCAPGAVKFADTQVNMYKKESEKLKAELSEKALDGVYKNIELPLTKVLDSMENEGFKIDEKVLKETNEKITQELEVLENEIYNLAGEKFNINSPKQVSFILFDKLAIQSYNNKKGSTNINILSELAVEHEIAQKIIDYRKLAKLKNTYLDVYMSILSTSGDIIHTVFSQTLTTTGRLSSSEPNLQNIPKRTDVGRQIRQIFVSKFEGGKIISADYNQIELRLLAHMSGEESLINSYLNGEDIHRRTASEIFGVDPNLVTSDMRRDAKAVNFGIIYGISDYGLSQNIKSTRKMAKAYIDTYFERYPKVKSYMDENVEFARKNGYAITIFGRKRYIPEISSSNYNTRTFGERVAMNMPLQGSASDIIKLAMIAVYEKLKNLKSKLILQVHDELIVDCYHGEEEKVCKILKESMENVVSLKVPLVVKVEMGTSLLFGD